MYDLIKKQSMLYFAYGSNMNIGQLTSRGIRPKVVSVARFCNHSIAFFGHTAVWDSAVETFLPQLGEDLWGVVFELSFSDKDILDTWQDVRLDGTGAYFHYPADVIADDGSHYSVLLYKKDVLGQPQLPSKEYMDFIIQGAVMHRLPGVYIDRLKKIPAKDASYTVPKRSKYDRSLLIATECQECGDLRASKGGPGFEVA